MSPGSSTECPEQPHPATRIRPDADSDVQETEVLVVGAGPAGCMLATQLARFGIKTKIIDERPDRTPTGRADGLQPKTIETFKQMRIAEPVLRKGVKIFDIAFWNSSAGQKLKRTGRQDHFPPIVDVLEPFILLVHQGMVESLFLDDMKQRGLEVERNCVFETCTVKEDETYPVEAVYKDKIKNCTKRVRAKYVVGCDGAHSSVRKCMPGVAMEGETGDVFWGVLDGVVETDFPDLWSKCAISSHEAGTILCIPREKNMTRLYIELSTAGRAGDGKISKTIAKDFVIERAKAILKPYTIDWTSIEWFGVYQIGQRVSTSFSHKNRIFIAGDAGHTHSPKAAQGMNVSMHDTYNLSWKLAEVLQGLAKPAILDTYAEERRKIACDLIRFDHEHAKAFIKNDSKALAENFKTNIRFISGVGAVYGPNSLNHPSWTSTRLVPGELLVPARAVRYVDANPVDLQLDIPVLGQWRLYFLAKDYQASKYFLNTIAEFITSPLSVLGRASEKSKSAPTPARAEADDIVQPQRYTTAGRLFTPALITQTPQAELELSDLCSMMRDARWTVYLDRLDGRTSPFKKWVGGEIREGETVLAVVRPDGYVGAIGKWVPEGVEQAAVWVESYFGGFLEG